jgi:glycosyltransferase involved in cell wall biosynthesis
VATIRVLLISDVPMVPELGGGRVQLEAAEALSQLGHDVTTYDPRDAFGRAPHLHRFRPLLFARRARDFARARASRFDVIDALQGCLPHSKREILFDGLLVVRSTGLRPFYREYIDYERERWPERVPGYRLTAGVHHWNRARVDHAVWHSYEVSDVIRVLNADERGFFESHSSLLDRVVELPEGLPDRHIDALLATGADPDRRLARREVVAVGAWSLRKGAADWPAIIRLTHARVPEARFRFLGTGVSAEGIRRHLDPGVDVEIVEHYRSTELPQLLATATVGALPSYIEGFPLGVLEQLAAGIPSIAYDVPGPRTTLKFEPSLLLRRGDVAAFAERLATILLMRANEYATLAQRCAAAVHEYRLSTLAPQLARMYEERRQRLGASGQK